MEISEQICSFELAKRLKELGVKQESLFYRFGMKDYQYIFCKIYEQYSEHVDLNINDGYSAFTVAELGEMLPSHRTVSLRYVNKSGWRCRDLYGYAPVHKHYTEADVRAEMLIYFIENNLLSPKEIKLIKA